MVLIKRFIVFIFVYLCKLVPLCAQVNLHIEFHSAGTEDIMKAELSIMKDDQTVAFTILDKPFYSIKLPSQGLYKLNVSHMTHEVYVHDINITKDTTLCVTLKERAINLNEVLVSSHRSPTATSNGEVFYLSKKAKSSEDPFRALSEIPLLRVDISNQTLTMSNGESPLVLIDGKLVNSGVKPILPQNIESVEIRDIVSAKYLEMGISKIVNIRLKKTDNLYKYVDIRTRHDIPVREGFGGTNFEFGNSKLAIFGSLFYNYLHNDRIDEAIIEQSLDDNKIRNGYIKKGEKSNTEELLLKWVPSPKDYVSIVIKNRGNVTKSHGAFDSKYDGTKSYSFTANESNKINEGGTLWGLYHEHEFKDNSKFTTFMKYNYGYYDMAQEYEEVYENHDLTQIDLRTKRSQYSISLDYESKEGANGSFAIGNKLEYTKDNVRNVSLNPELGKDVRLINGYIHSTYYGQYHNLYFMGSMGLQYLSTDVDEILHRYFRPHASASLTWRIRKHNSLRFSYMLTNSLPQSAQLVTYNQSPNPWVHLEGNPLLEPTRKHTISINYIKNWTKIRWQLFGKQDFYNDIIEPYMYNNHEYQVQSFRNNGTYSGLTIGTSLNYNTDNVSINLSPSVLVEHFNGQQSRNSEEINASFRWDIGDFFIYSSVIWKNKKYSAISRTEYKNPTIAHIQFAWQINKHWYTSIGLPYFWGIRKEEMFINEGSYSSQMASQYSSASLRPWILVSWTMRKNSKKAIQRRMPSI